MNNILDNQVLPTVGTPSGGKSSSYMSIHYPSDHEIFALVCIDDHNANGPYWRNNKKLKQIVQDKLAKTSSHWPEFLATAEDPMIITTMVDLEQKLGREIKWVRGVGFDRMIERQKAIPNIKMRFCTFYTKILPTFEFCYNHIGPVEMRIGFRYDESERAKDLIETIDFPINCNLYGAGRQNWIKDFHWRKLRFDLINDKIMRPHVNTYWEQNPDVRFAEDTGCQMCYWKDPQQLHINSLKGDTSSIIKWANVTEHIRGKRFKKDISMGSVFDIGLQLDFFSGGGPGCKAGGCGI